MIELVTHPDAPELWQARHDQAIVTNTPLVENPWWFRDEKGRTYYDLVGCLGWPGEVTNKGEGKPGYVGIIGIVRAEGEPRDAPFIILDEFESRNVISLLDACVDLRARWGYGCQPDLLQVFYGDPERHLTETARYNERHFIKSGKENKSLSVIPPIDFYHPKVFDIYVRTLRNALTAESRRLYVGKTEIFKNRLREFTRDDPAVLAVGGAVHTLLSQTIWMREAESNAFTVEEAA